MARRRREDIDFMPDLHQSMKRVGSRFAYVLSLAVIIFFGGFIFWASQAAIDEVTRGEGRVVPSGRIQTMQNLEGGILSELAVDEGDIVERGDILLRIENTSGASDYQENLSQLLSLKAAIARLEAELEGKELVFPPEVEEQAPAAAASERALAGARATQLQSEIAVLQDQATQRRNEIREIQTKLSSLQQSLALARDEEAILAPLVQKGVASKLELVRNQRDISELRGQINNLQASLPRAQAAISESEQRIEEKRATFAAEARGELNQRRVQFAALSEKIKAGQDRVARTEVRSPVRGIIKELKVNTIGGVIRPGEDLVDIVPLEDSLIIEAQLKPRDIAFLRPGLPATVKITAYDFSIYGGLDAKLEQISPDAIENEKGEAFFHVYLRTEASSLKKGNEELPIIPGMTATAEILTGKKTVLDYLMKPILKARDNALHER
ncbi:MAG: HlyD family type I secretion periplasmic adaptor subunit [Alphaproteobacteria bacterium]